MNANITLSNFNMRILCVITPIYLLLLIDILLYTEAYMKNVRIDDIPFNGLISDTIKSNYGKLSDKALLQNGQYNNIRNGAAGIYAARATQLTNRSFFNIFKIPSTSAPNTEVIRSEATKCNCAKLDNAPEPIVYFDRDHIGNVSADTIRNTIEFLENFLPPQASTNKKNKNRKNRVRSRIDDMNIE